MAATVLAADLWVIGRHPLERASDSARRAEPPEQAPPQAPRPLSAGTWPPALTYDDWTTSRPTAPSAPTPPTTEAPTSVENPNGLPAIPRSAPREFLRALSKLYLAKSRVDGTRSFVPGSELRRRTGCADTMTSQARYAASSQLLDAALGAPPDRRRTDDLPRLVRSYVDAVPGAAYIPRTDERLCSWGADPVAAAAPWSDWAPNVLHDVCVTLNVDSAKRSQRGIVYFDPTNSAALRCVGCLNPTEHFVWGQHACGLMWGHQLNAQSIDDLARCSAAEARAAKRAGQRQSPGSASDPLEPVRGAVVVPGTTMLLAFASKNPGHQLFDSVLSLVPYLIGEFAVPRRIHLSQNPACADASEWACVMLRRLGLFRDPYDPSRELLLPPDVPGTLTCFSNLHVPRWGMARNAARLPDAWMGRFRVKLHAAFGLSPTARADPWSPTARLALYAHDTLSREVGRTRRTWLRMNETAASAATRFAHVATVPDFGRLSIDEQARVFHAADVLAMAHGGQMGNAVFARPGTIVIELNCNSYSHLGLTNAPAGIFGSIPRAFGLVHIVLRPCDCVVGPGEGLDEADFRFSGAALDGVLNALRAEPLQPGTYHAHAVPALKRLEGDRLGWTGKRHGGGCISSDGLPELAAALAAASVANS